MSLPSRQAQMLSRDYIWLFSQRFVFLVEKLSLPNGAAWDDSCKSIQSKRADVSFLGRKSTRGRRTEKGTSFSLANQEHETRKRKRILSVIYAPLNKIQGNVLRSVGSAVGFILWEHFIATFRWEHGRGHHFLDQDSKESR